ncbi:MAG: hypothetical protein FWF88_13625, partial [Peptococcaceae bacterium]|nr:hypothetical protein [Peptococcaceae bacterium]
AQRAQNKTALRSFSAPMPKSCCRPSRKGLANAPHTPPNLRPPLPTAPSCPSGWGPVGNRRVAKINPFYLLTRNTPAAS